MNIEVSSRKGKAGMFLVMLAAMCLYAGPALAGMCGGGGGGCGCGGGGSTVIDPPIGAIFKDPAEIKNLSTTPGVVDVKLEAKIASININGTMAQLMTYNGSFPGPTIRAHKGDTLRINIKNSLPATTATNILGFQKNLTNLHTHGLHVTPEAPGDYVMYALSSGQSYQHQYDMSMQEAGALTFYHPHKHGVVAEQYWAGLLGALIVEDDTPALAGFETHLMILKDITLSGSSPAPHSTMMDYMCGKEGNTIMVNGQVNPRLYMKTGQVQRWRILNGSNARFYKLSLEGHTMNLIGTDDGLLDKPYPVTEILLSPGERVDILVKGTQKSGNYKLKALPYSRMGMGMGGSSGSQTITLLTTSYNGTKSPAQSIPASINPSAVRLDPSTLDIAAERTLTLSMGQGRGYVNGQDFDVDPYIMMSDVNTYEIWTIVNQSSMDHPFHQHVNGAQILSISGGDPNYASLYTSIPAWKDVVIVPKMGSVTMLVPVKDYTGMTMFHCHILEHEDIGMMGHWHIMGIPM